MTKSKDFWAGLVFTVCGAGLFLISQDYPLGTAQRIGPGYFPTAVSVLLFALGVLITIKSFFVPSEHVEKINPRIFVVIVSVVAFGLLLRSLGLFATVIVASFLASLASRESTFKEAFLLAVSLAVIVVVIFGWGLKIQVNMWPI